MPAWQLADYTQTHRQTDTQTHTHTHTWCYVVRCKIFLNPRVILHRTNSCTWPRLMLRCQIFSCAWTLVLRCTHLNTQFLMLCCMIFSGAWTRTWCHVVWPFSVCFLFLELQSPRHVACSHVETAAAEAQLRAIRSRKRIVSVNNVWINSFKKHENAKHLTRPQSDGFNHMC
jgi:hypothetical protein